MANIIQIPGEYYHNLEYIMNNTFKTIDQSLLRIMRYANDETLDTIVDEFPIMIAAIDNPTDSMKKNIDPSNLIWANNLTIDEIEFMTSNDYTAVDQMIGNNRKVATDEMKVEFALEIIKEYDIEYCFRTYMDCKWYIDAVKLYKLENL